MNPIIWLVALVIVFVVYDEGQRLRRRVKSLEDRLDRLEGVSREPEGGRSSGRTTFEGGDDRGGGRYPS